MKKWIKWGAIALVALLALKGLMGGGDDKPAADAPAPAPAADSAAPADAPAEAPKEAAKDASAALGSPVEVKGWTWTVASATDRGQELDSGNQFIDNLKTTGKFLELEATVQNTSTDASFVAPPKVVDSAGREFSHHAEGSSFIAEDKRCVLEQVNPGMGRTCAWLYEVPADATGLQAALSDGAFSDPKLVSLGQ